MAAAEHDRPGERVTVVGAGTMGHGIAQVFAQSGYDVTLSDVDEEVLTTALENVRNSLERFGVEDVEAVLDRIATSTDTEAASADADLVIEAVPEDIELKQSIFRDVDAAAPESAILATNTSTLPITEIASVTDRPDRVVGMHFSNPVQLMEIVEVIRGEHTAEDTFSSAQRFAESVGKTPILVEKDIPGFLINRVNIPYWMEALRQVESGGYDVPTIDAAMHRLGLPMGPFEVLDFTGIDVATMAAESIADRGVAVHVSDRLQSMVEDGHHGVKTGHGFYDYPAPGQFESVDLPRERRYEFDPKVLLAPAVNEAAWLVERDVTTKAEIDRAMQIGMNWPRGLFEFADEIGIDRLVDTLEGLHEESGWEEYRPNDLLVAKVQSDQTGENAGVGFYEYEYGRETFDTVVYERQGPTAWITLNRPDQLNALDEQTWNGLRRALEHAAEDESVRATVLQGAGRAFCAGDDIGELRSWETDAQARAGVMETIEPAVEALRTHPKPVIAAVDGVANGGGCELVILSDLAVASTSSDFALPEANIGALPPIALTYGQSSLDKKSFMELALTGDQFTATEAQEMGIVNYAVDGDQVDDVARELARSTRSAGPNAVAAIKDLWVDIEDDVAAAWSEPAFERLVELTQSEEAERGLQAFLDKEAPPWAE